MPITAVHFLFSDFINDSFKLFKFSLTQVLFRSPF